MKLSELREQSDLAPMIEVPARYDSLLRALESQEEKAA